MTRSIGWMVVLAAALAGCAADKPKPTALETVAPQMSVRQVWSAKLGAVQMPLIVTARSDAFVVAGSDGGVTAFDPASGRELWRGQAGGKLAAGVGSDGRFAAVVTADNELVVLERGALKWKAPLDSRTATAPFVGGERVFVMGVDRVVHAYDALDGRRIWTYQRTGEPLTLALPGLIAAYKDTLVVGQGAAMVGLDPTRGSVRWEVAVTQPRGTNEVERLNDLVGPALRLGDTLCARSFQTAVGCVAADKATLRWSRLNGGLNAIGGDADTVFGADASDRISAWRTANGDLAWTNEKLLYRALSAPVVLGKAVMFGDYEGQLHFLSREDGKLLLRLPTDGSAVAAAPALAGDIALVVTRNGGLFAFRAE